MSEWSRGADARGDAVPGQAARALEGASLPAAWHTALAPAAARLALVAVALWLFVLALQLIKTGAGGLRPVLDSLSAGGVLGHIGLGWAGAYVVMSGSPVAAVALSLFAGGVASDSETFAMINGSRLGASLIVLVVGFVAYARGRRNPDGLYVGVVAMLTAFTLWLPVVPLGLAILDSGVLTGVRVHDAFGLASVVDVVTAPVMDPARAHLARWLLALAGIGVLATAFAVFDRVLPDLDRPGPRLERASRALQQKYAMFAFGSLVTLVTLSVSLSVTLLVPLALKGYVQRDRVIPYVMGANITTWIDTLLAAVLLDSPRAFTIVLTEMVAGGTLSLLVLAFFYEPYTRVILWAAHRVSTSRRAMALFLGAFVAMPALLLAL